MTSPTITVDRRELGRVACEHLIALGHRRIAYLGQANVYASKLRMHGFLEAIHRHQLPIPATWLIETDRGEAADRLRRLRALLSAPDRPEALCVLDPRGIQDIILELGLRIPQDVAMIDCGSSPLPLAPVPLTHASDSVQDLCDQALAMFDKMRRTEEGIDASDCGPMPVLLPVHVTIGDSCGANIGKSVPSR